MREQVEQQASGSNVLLASTINSVTNAGFATMVGRSVCGDRADGSGQQS